MKVRGLSPRECHVHRWPVKSIAGALSGEAVCPSPAHVGAWEKPEQLRETGLHRWPGARQGLGWSGLRSEALTNLLGATPAGRTFDALGR